MWTVSQTLTLIDDLHKIPCLWDVHCVDYKSLSKKAEAFDVLSKKYGVNPEYIEKKIQGLKNQFRREHRKFLEHTRNGSYAKKPQWFGYESLSFLLQVYESRGNRIDDTEDSYMNEVNYNVLPVECEIEDVEDDNRADSGVEVFPVDNHSFRSPATKRKKSLDGAFINETFKCMKVLTENISKRDEFSVFGEHIANRLRLSGRSQFEIAIAQHKIDEVCFQLSIGLFSIPDNEHMHQHLHPPILQNPTPPSNSGSVNNSTSTK